MQVDNVETPKFHIAEKVFADNVGDGMIVGITPVVVFRYAVKKLHGGDVVTGVHEEAIGNIPPLPESAWRGAEDAN